MIFPRRLRVGRAMPRVLLLFVFVLTTSGCSWMGAAFAPRHVGPSDADWSEYELVDGVTFSFPDRVPEKIRKVGFGCYEGVLFSTAPVWFGDDYVRVAVFRISYRQNTTAFLHDYGVRWELNDPALTFRGNSIAYVTLLDAGKRFHVSVECVLPQPYHKHRARSHFERNPEFFSDLEPLLARIVASVKVKGKPVMCEEHVRFEYRERDSLREEFGAFNKALLGERAATTTRQTTTVRRDERD